jgi:hypothetical protein
MSSMGSREDQTMSNLKLLYYYSDIICEKIDLQTDVFMQRIEALRNGDWGKVEFIEEMMLKPLSSQITYLAEKASAL